MNATVYIPKNDLKDTIDCIWYQEIKDYSISTLSIAFLQQEIIINLGDHFSIKYNSDKAFNYTAEGGVSGISSQPILTSVKGDYKAIGVLFKPSGLYNLFGLNASLLASTPLTLGQLTGVNTGELIENLKNAKTEMSKIMIFEQYLLKAARPVNIPLDISYFANSLDHEPLKKGRIKEYLHRNRFTAKGYIQQFKSVYGQPPKKYLQIKQIDKAIHLIAANPVSNLTDIAYQCGFYDQSHFIKLFKSLSGITPLTYNRAVVMRKINPDYPNTIHF